MKLAINFSLPTILLALFSLMLVLPTSAQKPGMKTPRPQVNKSANSTAVKTASNAPSGPGTAILKFDVILQDAGANKLNVVKEVKNLFGLSLNEAKDLVDSAPCVLKAGVDKAEAQSIEASLESVGATVALNTAGDPNAPSGSGNEIQKFDVILQDAGANKLNVVKEVKNLFGLDLKAAKDLVDCAPCVLKESVSKAEAESIKTSLESVGATVALNALVIILKFDVILQDAGANKLNVVKEVKNLFGLGLKEAKDLVDSAPCVLKAGVDKAEAQSIEASLESAGATVALNTAADPNAPSGPGNAIQKFDVILKDAGANKLNVVKEVKNLFGLGLKEAKDLVDGAPCVLKAGVSKAEAESIETSLEAAGAIVELNAHAEIWHPKRQ